MKFLLFAFKMKSVLYAFVLICVANVANAQDIYRCTSASGLTAYQDHPCAQATTNAGNGANAGNPRIRVISELKINALRVRQVRVQHAQCKSGWYDHLELVGPIGPDSSEVVDRVLEKLPRCGHKNSPDSFAPIVYLVSGGGELEHGYKLGHTLRKYGAQTIVPPREVCASACAVAFLGGQYRTIDTEGQLLFHSPYLKTGDAVYCPGKDQMVGLRQYFVQYLGAKDGQFLFERTMTFCSQRAGWAINSDAARLFGITTN
ncbi:MAG TPA: hypothetical protein PK306_03205 [Aquabacterium sp.]|nr:hypothetical protein [Aquabacterium sp.]